MSFFLGTSLALLLGMTRTTEDTMTTITDTIHALDLINDDASRGALRAIADHYAELYADAIRAEFGESTIVDFDIDTTVSGGGRGVTVDGSTWDDRSEAAWLAGQEAWGTLCDHLSDGIVDGVSWDEDDERYIHEDD